MNSTVRFRRLFSSKAFSAAVFLGLLCAFRFCTKPQLELLFYVAFSCAGLFFFILGANALYVRAQINRKLLRPSLYSLASRRQEEWLGLMLMPIGFLVLAFGRVNLPALRQDWTALGGILVFFTEYLIWRGAYAIWIDGSMLHYTSLGGGYRHVCLDEIISAKSIVGFHPQRPTQRLEIYTKLDKDWPIVINRAIFNRKSIDELIIWLGPKLGRLAQAAG